MQFTVMSLHTFLYNPLRLQSIIDRRNDEIAKAQICLRLHPAQLKRVKNSKHTCTVWKTLKEIFDPTPEDSASNRFLDFIHYRMKTGQNVKAYLDHLTEVYHELALQKVMIGEPAFVVKALDGLTQEFSQTTAAAKASGIHTISEIYNLLIAAQKERNGRKNTDITSLNTESRSRGYCTRCRTETHNTSHCWILHPELRPNSNSNGNNNNSNRSNRFRRNHRTNNARNYHTHQRSESQQTQQEQDDSEPETFTGYNTTSNTIADDDLLIDSGANKSMTNDRSILTNYRSDTKNQNVTCSNGQLLTVHGRGDITLKQHNIKLRDVLYVPQLTKTLIATKSLTNQGLRIHIDDNLQVYEGKHHLFTAKEHNNLYFLPKESVTQYQANETITLEQAHKRFGHASTERLTKLQDATRDIQISTNTRHFCDICAQSKSVRQPFPKERETKPTRRYEIVSSDLKGPLQIEGSQGHRYFITFNCLYTKWTWVTFVESGQPQPNRLNQVG
jgi:hypothetical protein